MSDLAALRKLVEAAPLWIEEGSRGEAFYAAARSALPELLDEVERLRVILRAAEAFLAAPVRMNRVDCTWWDFLIQRPEGVALILAVDSALAAEGKP